MNVGSDYPISRFRGSRQKGTTIYNNLSTYNYHIFAKINSELICKTFLILKICVIKYSSYIGTPQTAHHSNDNKKVVEGLLAAGNGFHILAIQSKTLRNGIFLLTSIPFLPGKPGGPGYPATPCGI